MVTKPGVPVWMERKKYCDICKKYVTKYHTHWGKAEKVAYPEIKKEE